LLGATTSYNHFGPPKVVQQLVTIILSPPPKISVGCRLATKLCRATLQQHVFPDSWSSCALQDHKLTVPVNINGELSRGACYLYLRFSAVAPTVCNFT